MAPICTGRVTTEEAAKWWAGHLDYATAQSRPNWPVNPCRSCGCTHREHHNRPRRFAPPVEQRCCDGCDHRTDEDIALEADLERDAPLVESMMRWDREDWLASPEADANDD